MQLARRCPKRSAGGQSLVQLAAGDGPGLRAALHRNA
jgi:hypothetical protein